MTAPSASGHLGRYALMGALTLALPACNTFERISNVGSGPALSQIEDPRTKPGYVPVSMPMPTPTPTQRGPAALWRSGARDFFRDHRASQVGDVITVFVVVNDATDLKDTSTRGRGNGADGNSENMTIPVLPPTLAAGFSKIFGNTALGYGPNTSGNSGGGEIKKVDTVTMQLAAAVIQVLPNGNLVINGKQEMKVADQIRELSITGIVRPDDVDSANQISYERIAEARISYSGKGYLNDVQTPRYGSELLDILLPF